MRTIGNPEEFNQKMTEVINTTKNAKGDALNNLPERLIFKKVF